MKKYFFLMTIKNCKNVQDIQKKIIANGEKLVTLVHPKSVVGRNVNIGLAL